MIYLILSVVCSTIISVVFRLFKDFEIDTFQAIIYNYIVCLVVGTAIMGESPLQGNFWQLPWFPYAALLGSIFIATFVLIARTIQTFGISITAVMQRMSLIITVTFAFVFFQEAITFFKIAGIIFALLAVFLASYKPSELKTQKLQNKWLVFLPFAVLLASGFIESVLQYVQAVLLTDNTGQLKFTTFLFGTAAFFGIILLIFNLLTSRMKFHFRHLVAGIALGVPNFGSIYFLLKMLESGWDGSVVFPINNVAVIILSTVIAILMFQEKLTKLNKLGILMAVIAIILIAYAQFQISN